MPVSAIATQPQKQVEIAAAFLPVKAMGLGKSIDRRAILQDVSFEVGPGEYVAIVGANGAGKSTLLKMLSTLTTPSTGTLNLFGLSAGRELAKVRMNIGLVAHQSMLYRDLSARENLEFFGKLYGIADPCGRAKLLLDVVGMSTRADDPVRAFSRGMTQRIAIARALMHDPQLLLADEPFDGLDAPSAAATEQLLAHLNRCGKTVILVNHDIHQTLRLARRVVVLRQGRIAVDLPADQLDADRLLAEVSGS